MSGYKKYRCLMPSRPAQISLVLLRPRQHLRQGSPPAKSKLRLKFYATSLHIFAWLISRACPLLNHYSASGDASRMSTFYRWGDYFQC